MTDETFQRSFDVTPSAATSAGPDIFISYAHADNADGFIDRLVENLRSALAAFADIDTIFLDKTAIQSMDDWERVILRGLRSSSVLVAVLSPNYFLSSFCRREWREFQRLGSEPALGALTESAACLYIEPCSPFDRSEHLAREELVRELIALAEAQGLPPERRPSDDPATAAELDAWTTYLRQIQYDNLADLRAADIASIKDEVVRERLAGLSERLKHVASRNRRRRESPMGVLLPRHNPAFVGRVEELSALRDALNVKEKEGTVAVLQSALGGIGKSAIAFEYAHVFAPEYPGGRFLIY